MNIITFQLWRLELLLRNKFLGTKWAIPNSYKKLKDDKIEYRHKGPTLKT